MPIYDLELPDKRVLTLEAPDPDSAMSAAQSWHQSNPAQSAPVSAEGIAKSAGVGLGNAAIGTIGAGGDARSLSETAAQKLAALVGASPETASMIGKGVGKGLGALIPMMSGPTSAEIRAPIEKVTGQFYKPQNVTEEFAQKTGEFLPSAALGPGGVARRLLTGVAAPAAGATMGGQAADKYLPPAARPWAEMAGAVVGGLTPGALARLVTPLPTNAARQQAVNTLRAEGVNDLTAGQVTGRPKLMALEAERGGPGAAATANNQAEQFTQATLARIGENAPRATPEVIDNAFTRIGGQFDTIGARNTLAVDRRLANDVAQAQAQYTYFANPGARETFHHAIDDVVALFQRNNGVIPGDQYNALRSRLGSTARAATQDNQLRSAFYDLQHALDDAMVRSMRTAGNAADATALTEARRQYRNLLTVERAATSGGAAAAEGLISPAALKNAEINTQGRRGYARGTGDFSQLARAGVSALTPLPNSGTPIRTSAQNLGMSVPMAGIGGTIGGFLTAGSPLGIGAGTIAGGYLPQVVGRAATSGPGRAYLGNQALAPFLQSLPPALQSAVVNAMISQMNAGPRLPARP